MQHSLFALMHSHIIVIFAPLMHCLVEFSDAGVVVHGDEGVVVLGCLQPPLILDPHPHLMIW